MTTILPPKYVRQVLITLKAHEHKVFLVGGCVRDTLLNVQPYDWDICTSALPEQVMEIFPGSVPTGLKHGTVTVKIGSHHIEVTTFRAEGRYSDHRRPDMVSFVGDLTTDLSRRDFTINAIALSPDGIVCDPFDGVSDIERRVIRCVGEPGKRFDEDALRMFRALRFSARLGFEIEQNTLAAISENSKLAASLAAERVRDEIEKIMLTPAPGTMAQVLELGLLDRYIDRMLPDRQLINCLVRLPKKALSRWAGFSILLERNLCIESVNDFLLSLRLDNRTRLACTGAAQILHAPLPASPLEWKRCLRRYGQSAVSCAAACADALFGTSCRKALRAVIKSGECYSIQQLAVTGDDLIALGFSGRELGEMLEFLLAYVMEFPDNNQRSLLLSLARSSEEL